MHWRGERGLAAAEACFRAALRVRPDYDSALKNLVLVLHKRGALAAMPQLCGALQRGIAPQVRGG